MTIDRAIKHLKLIVDNEAYTGSFQDVCRTSIEALEKQIPKKPLDVCTPVVTWGLCPECKGELNKLGGKPNRLLKGTAYCPDCGQALDWSEER